MPVSTPAENLVGLPAETETDALACGGPNPGGATAPAAGQVNVLTAPGSIDRPADVVADTRTFYDDPTLAKSWPQPLNPNSPRTADASVVQAATGYSGGAFSYQTRSTAVATDPASDNSTRRRRRNAAFEHDLHPPLLD
ncbi:MAG TPA: hypothetical protein VGM14_02220 [Streptosporangiaceae bacterium]